jgi:simple sugar transport system permease protein
LPFAGIVFGRQSPVVYLSLVLIPLLWWWVFMTRPGLELRAVGEKPQAAFARGIRVQSLRTLYTLLGGALVGLAGGAFSLGVKPGWGRPQGAEGTGWIALALVIFGGWHPVRAALGAYLFAALQVLGITLQERFPGLPAPLFQVSPFPVMILTLLAANVGRTGWFQDLAFRYPGLKGWLSRWQASAPAALGQNFQPEKEG